MDMFSNLLDDVIGNSSAPRIISEQHDLTQVNWLRGMADPGEMLECGYLPELRRRDHESAETHYARILPIFLALPAEIQEKLNAAGHGAATRRHQLATTGGKVAYIGVKGASWHQLGTDVSRAFSFAEAIKLAPHVDITIEKRQNTCPTRNGSKLAPSYSLVRVDTDDIFATVGHGYKVIQPRDAFDYADSVLGKFGAKIETLGHTFNGKSMFMSVQFPNLTFEINGKDTIFAYGIFTNQHGGRAATFFPSTYAACCANTQRMASNQYGKLGVTIRHTGNLQAKVADAQRALKIGVESFGTYRESAETMAKTKIEARPYFNAILDEVCDVTEAQAAAGAGRLLALMANRSAAEREAKVKQFERQVKDRKELLNEMVEAHHSRTNADHGDLGTVWSAYNAVTQWADHHKPGRKVGTTADQQARLFESRLVGERDEVKQVAYTQALAAI